ncbi:hypothetical protein B5F27_16180 [Faecalibacterium sp. An192]|nr:hypothetical protein B5F27_16180 [Faecalibacterium sp. An192]
MLPLLLRTVVTGLLVPVIVDILWGCSRHETLYIFGKELELLERFGSEKKLVSLYIKFNKLDGNYVIVVSFHEAHYPLKKYFH